MCTASFKNGGTNWHVQTEETIIEIIQVCYPGMDVVNSCLF